MDGIAVQTNLHGASVRPSLIGRTKGTAPRKALAQIQNVQQAKNVKFEGVKPSMKPLMQHGKLKTLTPSSKGLKINTPGNRSAVRSKTPFKIHQDNVETKSKVENTVQPKHESVAEKEYMPPNTDRDFEFPMPDYLQRVLTSKPRFTVDLTPEITELDPDILTPVFTPEFLNKLTKEEATDVNEDLDTFLTEFSEEKLLYELENDDTFSLEALDRELRAAGLDVPEW